KLSPSIGESGSIFVSIGYTTHNLPNKKFSVVSIPFLEFSLKHLLVFFMGLDFVGIVGGWKAIDHCARFIRALFGLLYAKYGSDW
ncbi:hypothetical protein K502DRAFT_275939, partial [Neoconidiobolus thromboides FSU 785]